MEWLLGFSVVLNIGLLVVVAVLVYTLVSAQNEAFHNYQEWSKWEGRWFEIQTLVVDKFDHYVSPSGMKTEVRVSKIGDK